MDINFLWLAATLLLAGFTQGVSGFGAALVAMPLLTLFMDVQTAVPLYLLHGVVITGYLSFQLRQHFEWPKIKPLLLGSLPGIVLGIYLLKRFNSSVLQSLMGALIFSYALYSLTCRPQPKKLAPFWAYIAGFFTGAISSAFSAGGPPTVIYVTLSGWNKDVFKVTLSVFFFITGVLTVTGHALSGLTTIPILKLFLGSVIFTVVGVWLGSLCYGKIQRETYIKIMLWMLVGMGVLMMVGRFL
nr:sulfite exporter TauE/SafE family protein [Desulfobulbaceae bacterium]